MTGTEVKPPKGARTAPRRAAAKRGAAHADAAVAKHPETLPAGGPAPAPEVEAVALAPPAPVAEEPPEPEPAVAAPLAPEVSALGGIESLAAFGTAHLGALIRANAVFAGGVEAISLEVFGQAQASFTSVAAVAKAMLSARTLKDVVELNASFAQAQCEVLVANASRLAELTLRVATETAAPLAAQATSMVEHAGRLPA